jgi:superfamily II DNA or RNA helicase
MAKPMLPSEALTFQFSKQTRAKGASYVQPGLIKIIQGSATALSAVVRGTSAYQVGIERRMTDEAVTEFAVSCTCAFSQDRPEACKHVWAALCFAEREGFLRGDDRPLSRHAVRLVVDRGRTPSSPLATSPARVRPNRPGSASAFLAGLSQRLSATQAATRTPRYGDSTFMYVIDAFESADRPFVVVRVLHQARTRAALTGRPEPVSLSNDDLARLPPADRRLMALLWGADSANPFTARSPAEDRPAVFRVSAPLSTELIPLIARSARGWLRSGTDASILEPVTWDAGNAWHFSLRIDAVADGYDVTGALVRDDVTVAVTEPFVLLAGGLIAIRRTIARFEADAATAFLQQLKLHGPVTIGSGDAPALAELVARSGIALPDLPESLRLIEVRESPTPRLSVQHGTAPSTGVLVGHLSFDYAGTVVSDQAAPTAFLDAATRRVIRRDPAAERAAQARLRALGFASGGPHGDELQIGWHELNRIVRELVGEGWYVEADGVRYRTPTMVDLAVSSGIDWFDLDAEVSFGDQIAHMPDLLGALRPDALTVRLGDGSIGILPEDWIHKYGGIVSAGEVEQDRIRFRRPQAALLDALLAEREADARITVDTVFRRARAELASFATVAPVEEPPSFVGSLRGYQREGLGWFGFLRQFGFGGCLADDMGLGKTVMVLALLDARRLEVPADGSRLPPSLIVVPRSLVGNWLAEARHFTPGLRLIDHSHGARAATTTEFENADAVIVTYGTLRRDIAALSAAEFDYVILDEAQTVKNAATAAAKATKLLRARHRLALSGTPIENHLGELWSLFEFLNPGILGRSAAFKRLTASDQPDRPTAALLARGLRPFILRRTKRQVARELPERSEQTILCELLPKDRRLYDSLRHHYRASLLGQIDTRGFAKSKMHVLEALLRLRQAACHPGLIDPRRAGDESAKFDILLPQLQEVVAEGHKALVFSQFTTLLGLLRARLDKERLTYEYLDGHTRDRTKRVQRFQEDPNVGLFLISLKAGGLGLNLTAAEYVFLLDPWWNPAAEAQAIDRAHRIGQTREVFAYRLIATDTVEEKVLLLQQSKRELADAVLAADTVGLRDLTREDLELLLS